jgi:hypothetical protein
MPKIVAELKQAIEAAEEAMDKRDKAAEDMFQLGQPCVCQCKVRVEQDCPGTDCENIPTWIPFCLATVFSQQGEISVFKSPKRFLEFSWTKTSLFNFFIDFSLI